MDQANRIHLGRRFRHLLGVRALLALVLVVAGLLGWWDHLARVQRDGVATVKRLGGRVWYGWDVQNRRLNPVAIPGWRKWLIDKLGPDYVGSVTQVNLGYGGESINPSVGDLASIGRLSRLEHLSIAYPPAAREGLAQLRNLSRLKHLDFSEFGGTEANDLAALADLAKLEDLQLSRNPVRDADLTPIAGLIRLKRLQLNSPTWSSPNAPLSITDAGLAKLEGLRDLEELQIIGDNQITNAGLAHIAGLSRMETLTISASKITSLEQIRPLVNLKYLGITGTSDENSGLDAEGAAPLAGFTKLVMLSVWGRRFNDAGLAHLRALPDLSLLDIRGTSVDDAGIASLVAIPRLKNLVLASTFVSDAGLAALAKRPGYVAIDVESTKVTTEGLAAARLALPSTQILPKGNQIVIHPAGPGSMSSDSFSTIVTP